MPDMTLICRNATTFDKDGSVDEEAFRQFLQRFVDAKLGVYIGSGGSGEGHALTNEELTRIYRIGVEVGKGKIRVNSNQPEQNTARDSLAHALIAIEAGIEVINIYGPEGRHAYSASDEEYMSYFDMIFRTVKHPTALCPNPTIGYLPKPQVVADICRKYPQVVAINLSGIKSDDYFIQLLDVLTRDVEIFVPYVGSLNTLGLGATGLLGAEANVIPKTFRQYIDLYEAGKFDELAPVYGHLRRFTMYTDKWRTSPRWIKMALKAFKLPGGEGGLRDPFEMPSEQNYKKFIDGLIALKIPEVDDMAKAAGLL